MHARPGLSAHDYWPLITDAFLHGGWLHIIFNMWFLWIFGPAMEARFGRFWFLALYFGGALVASTLHVATHPDSTEPVLGASGAIAAVIAAYAVIYPTERVITIVPILFSPLFVPVPAILFAGLWLGLQILLLKASCTSSKAAADGAIARRNSARRQRFTIASCAGRSAGALRHHVPLRTCVEKSSGSSTRVVRGCISAPITAAVSAATSSSASILSITACAAVSITSFC